MSIQKHARDVLFYDLSVSRRAAQAPYPQLRDLLPFWEKSLNDPNISPKEFEKGSITAIIRDIKNDVENDIATLLVEVSDKNAPNTTYLDHNHRTSRHIQKEEEEGNGFSAHIVMSLKSNIESTNTYLSLIESVPTVSVSRIQSLLNSIIKNYCKEDDLSNPFTYIRPNGGKKKEKYVPHILLGGYPSDRLLKDLEEGKINSIKLIAPETHQSLGTGQYLTMTELAMNVKVSKEIPKGQRWSTIFSSLKVKKDEFPKARIYIQPEANGKSFHVDIDMESQNVIGQVYVKSKRITDFDKPLDKSACENIAPDFEEKLKSILIGERDNGS